MATTHMLQNGPASLSLTDAPLAESELLERLRARAREELEWVERELAAQPDPGPDTAGRAGAPPDASARARCWCALLRQIVRALAHVQPGDLPAEGAGLGSALTLEDCRTGERVECLLMTGELLDLDAGQVSLASPIGRAVLGRTAGVRVEVALPRGSRAFRIRALETLPDRLGLSPAAPAGAANGAWAEPADG